MDKKIKDIYVKSGHKKEWNSYRRYGKEIDSYKTTSDNNIFEINGKMF